jgi:hypothetical protein
VTSKVGGTKVVMIPAGARNIRIAFKSSEVGQGLSSCNLPYFIEYSVHRSTVCTLILNRFFVHYSVKLIPFLKYLPSVMHRQYFTITFLKKCALYLTKYCIDKPAFRVKFLKGLHMVRPCLHILA